MTTVYPTISGLVITGGAAITLQTAFLSPLPLSGPCEQSPFMLAGAAWLSMDRAPLQHTAGYTGDVVIPPSAFRQGRTVEVLVDGVVVYTVTGYDPLEISGDGFVDAIDMDNFTAYWLAGDIRSDVNGDRFSDAVDYDLWMNMWLSR